VEQQLLSAEQQPAPAEQQVEQLPLWSSSSLRSAGCFQPDTAVEIRARVARLLFLSPSGVHSFVVLVAVSGIDRYSHLARTNGPDKSVVKLSVERSQLFRTQLFPRRLVGPSN